MKHLKSLALFLLMLHFCGVTVAQDAEGVPAAGSIAETIYSEGSDSTGYVALVLHWFDSHMSYTAVGALMAVESSFIPFPSELVIPPAVYVASNPEGNSGMNIWLIVLAGTVGALIGAYINYFLSRWLGRPIIYAFAESKVGHLLSLNREKVERAESYFNQHGNTSTLIGRLIPVIRQLISIPAGLSRMPIATFTVYTLLGAGLWNGVLALLGVLAYRAAKPDLIEQYSHQISIAIVVLCVLAIGFLIIRHLWRKKNKGDTAR